MKKINLTKIKDCKDLLKSTPKKEHFNNVINEDCIFFKDGKAVGLYIKIEDSKLTEIRKSALSTKLSKVREQEAYQPKVVFLVLCQE